MTPRALALDTAALLKPLSCQAIALASEAGTPLRAAIWPISEAVTRPGAACGTATGVSRRAGAGVRATAGAPVGSWRPEPMRSVAPALIPFMKAIGRAVTELRAGRLGRVSAG